MEQVVSNYNPVPAPAFVLGAPMLTRTRRLTRYGTFLRAPRAWGKQNGCVVQWADGLGVSNTCRVLSHTLMTSGSPPERACRKVKAAFLRSSGKAKACGAVVLVLAAAQLGNRAGLPLPPLFGDARDHGSATTNSAKAGHPQRLIHPSHSQLAEQIATEMTRGAILGFCGYHMGTGMVTYAQYALGRRNRPRRRLLGSTDTVSS
ncbi:unnamed protein product [Amoebophrya sp. A25]|nr:unnamed protein product [Amoebophrya sp. A25]|eukprot:GSA25T00019960001.1